MCLFAAKICSTYPGELSQTIRNVSVIRMHPRLSVAKYLTMCVVLLIFGATSLLAQKTNHLETRTFTVNVRTSQIAGDGEVKLKEREKTTETTSQQSSSNPKLPTIFVVGDSTANNNANGGRGWGDPFIDLFDTTKVNVLNRARAGRSSRTFITQGLWDNVLSEMKPGDVVLIQFGHNDAGPINDASRARGSLPGTGEETQEIDNLLTKEHEVVHTYGWYLRKMIADTKTKGAIPIVLSLTVRNIWKDGQVERGSGKFGQWAREVATSQHVQFLDVTNLIADRYEQLGEAKVKELFATDHTHTNPAGAELNASLILTGLTTLKGKQVDRLLNHRLHR
jgi:rhamnogalacturonan acetylesterase